MTRSGAKTSLVLVHGGGHDARCWEGTIAALRGNGDVGVLAIDLPGRGSRPGPLRGLTIDRCVDAVVEQVQAAGLARVVLVGHSMAGMIVPGVAAALGPARVERCVLVAANVAPDGGSVLDTLPMAARALARLASRVPIPYRMPSPLARALFCNGMSREQKRFVTDRLVPEAGWLARERIPMPPQASAVPITWILTRRDRAVPPKLQQRTIAALASVDEIIELDAPHDVMVSHPDELSALLLARLP